MKTIYVEKIFTDQQMDTLGNSFVQSKHIHQIFDEDVDVFSKEGDLLLRFRKNVLKQKDSDAFFDATYKFTTQNTTKNRGSTTGSKSKNVYENPIVQSSILGYFDRWAPNQKQYFKKAGMKLPLEVRETRFSADFPEKFKKILPLIQDINKYYKKLLPNYFKKQNAKAKQTHFKIPHTSFTTITTNVNFQTSIHKDKGDDGEGFGNLVVIERGRYSGGETCLPQFGIGVNVREGDVLFMDVHQWHGNLKIKPIDKDAVRMSVVCYLRTKIWERTKNKSESFKKKHLANTRKALKRANKHSKTRKKN